MNDLPIKVLLIDDDEEDFILTRYVFDEFKSNQFELEWIDNYADGLAAMKDCRHDIFLLDYRLGERTGLELLREAVENGCRAPVILLTGQGDKEIDFQAMQAGAADYLIKSELEAPLLERSIRYSLEHAQTLQKYRESEARYRNLVETLPVMFYAVQPEPPYAPFYLSPSFENLGYPLEKWHECKDLWMSILHPEDREWVLNEIESAIKADSETDYEYRLIAGDGTVRWVHDRGHFYKDENGKIVFWQGIIIDITERKQAEKTLSENEERYSNLFENTNDIVYVHDLEGNYLSVNKAAEKIFGYKREEILKMNMRQFIVPEDLEISKKKLAEKVSGIKNSIHEVRGLSKSGKQIPLEVNSCGIYKDGELVAVQGIARDITERKLAEEQIQYNALYDTLTDLPNRTHFMKQLTLACERAELESRFRFAVLFLDIDRFKIVNDSLGHLTGDKLLVGIAERLKSCVRPSDVIARLGGDEFTILLTIKEDIDALQIAERLLQKLSRPFKLDNYEVFTSASIGIIISDDIRRKPEEYLRDADTAMYRAKETGKARYEIFDRQMHLRNINLLKVETDLRRAIERGEFRAHYQPIIALDTGVICEFESLIRWEHPERGMIPPYEFISIAEETGLIIPIGEWILEESCRQLKEWRNLQTAEMLSISVNLSAKQLMHPSLVGQVKTVLEKTALDPHYLKLEVTESTVMEHSETALRVLSELQNLGVRLSTDDFGTGFSSLSYLRRFPFDRLKIDRSFINTMDQDAKSGEIVRTILMLAQNLNIETVAEGIETRQQLGQLQKLGCNFGQGFLFSKPVIAAEAEKLIKEGLPSKSENSFVAAEINQDSFIEIKNLQ